MDDMNQTHHDCVTSERIALIVVGIITTCLGGKMYVKHCFEVLQY